MSRPVWFMDIDGVLNMFPEDHVAAHLGGVQTFKASPNRWPGMSEEDEQEAKWWRGGLRRYQIMYDPAIIDRIREMHTSGRVEIVWLTTWGHGANGELRAGFKFPRFEVAGTPDDHSYKMDGTILTDDSTGWWKFGSLRQYLTNHPEIDRFIWTDDDHDMYPPCGQWARDRSHLVICTNYHTGLTHEDLDSIEAYLAADVQVASDGIR